MEAIDLDAVDAMMEGVTAGPWVRNTQNSVCSQIDGEHHAICTDQFCYAPPTEKEANARFIAAARELVPALAAEVRVQQATIAALEKRVELLTGALEEVAPWFYGEHYYDHPSCRVIRAALIEKTPDGS